MLEIKNIYKNFGGLKAVNNASMKVEKGSITINGISLTIANVNKDNFIVSIIPYTYKHTNLSTLNVPISYHRPVA